MKTNSVRGHQVELSSEIGQGSLSVDLADDARNIEQRRRRAEKRLAISIEAEDVVAEEFADVEKLSGAATKIDNAHRRRPIEPKIL